MDELKYFRVFQLPQCSFCQHYIGQKCKMTCQAYPAEIPDKWVYNQAVHDTVQEDQAGDYVFEEIPESNTEEEIEYMIEDIHTLSPCFCCQHRFSSGGCRAYPNGIPVRWRMWTKDRHDTVQADQQGDYVFTDQSEL